MPELPEVETICRDLRALLAGRRIIGVEVLEPRLRIRVSRHFVSELKGRTILDVERRGKYISMLLEEERVWLIHLGMSGKLVYLRRNLPRRKHDHLIVRLDCGGQLRYHDPRRFGLTLVANQAELETLTLMKNLGMDALGTGIDSCYLYSMARRSGRRVRDLLIDQRVVAGLGNIYANEILFRSGIRPMKRGWKLGHRGVERLAQVIPQVLREAIRWRGTSFSDYRDGKDRRGKFQNHLRVYDREGEECAVCASRIKKVFLGNRSAFYCPSCQK